MLAVVMTSLFVAAVYVLLPLMMGTKRRAEDDKGTPSQDSTGVWQWTLPCHRDRQDCRGQLCHR